MTDLYLRDLVPIVEMQALELKRLMRDKEQLSAKIDSLIGEIGSLRALQQQDQNLREREQALRSKMQQTISDLVRRSEGAGAAVKPTAKQVIKPAPVPADPVRAKTAAVVRQDSAKIADESQGAAEQTSPTAVKPANRDRERMEIPAFLANGPRVGFDRTTAEDIRNIHGPGLADGEAPIKKLLTRIRARNGAR